MPSDLERRAATSISPDRKTARDVIIANGPELEKALGKAIDVDHFVRGALTTLNANVELQTVTEATLMASLLLAAQLGLEIGNGLNQFHLTPRDVKVGRGKDAEYEHVCVPIIGYQGYVALAYRHSKTLDFAVIRVAEGDHFEQGYESERGKFFSWRPAEEKRGPYRGTLLSTRTAGGGRVETWMSRAEVEARRPAYTKEQTSRSGEVYTPNTPWKTHYVSMADKTCLREHQKYLPKSIEMQTALALDGRVLRRDQETLQLTTVLDPKDEQADGEEQPDGD